MSASFKLDESGPMADYIGGQIRKAGLAALVATANRVVNHITTVEIPGVTPHQPVDRAMYRAGWHAKPIPNIGAEINNSLPYASIIEYGAKAENIKPGVKMVEALMEWVKRKGLASKIVTNRRGKQALQKGTELEVYQIAVAIAFSLKKKGIFNGGKGLRILEKSLKHVSEWLPEEFEHEVQRAFKGPGSKA